MRFLLLCLSVLLVQPFPGLGVQAARAESRIPDTSSQMLLVITDQWQAVPARMYRFEREDATGSWHAVGTAIPAVVGSKGLGWGRGLHKDADTNHDYRVEFDKRGPAGIFDLGPVFGLARPDQAHKWLGSLNMPYIELKPGMFCVGDHASTHYNEIVDVSKTPKDWEDRHNEDMHQIAIADEKAYLWGVFIQHNITNPQSGQKRDQVSGSCIFLHIWKGPDEGTAGCTAMSKENMVTVIKWLDQARRPVLVQLPQAEYQRLKAAWSLPDVK